MIHGDFPEWITEGGLDSVTQYELWKSIWSSLNDGNFFELSWTVERHLTFCASFAPLTFLGNHDVTRIASKLNDIGHLGHALVVLFTLPGVPAVYYGDEQGFRGVKEDREGGDDAVRPAFPAGPESLAQEGWPIYRLHQDLIGLRRRHAWLTVARVEVLTLANEQFGYRAFGPGGESLLVLLNIGDQPFGFPVEDLGPTKLMLGSSEDGVGAGFSGVVDGLGWAVVAVG